MSNLKKHKRLYYVPGIISLLVIPLVFWFYVSNYIEQNDYRVISFNMPPKDHFENYPEENYKVNYHYKEVNVPVNFSKETEDNFFKLIKNLQEKNIDKSGIKFQFNSENTYNDIIQLLNLMEKTEQGRYLFDFKDDNFYVIHDKVSTDLEVSPIFICGGVLNLPTEEMEVSYLYLIRDFIQNIPKSSYPIIIGYFLLVICTIFRPKIFIPFPLKS